jgi:hypothetical protein
MRNFLRLVQIVRMVGGTIRLTVTSTFVEFILKQSLIKFKGRFERIQPKLVMRNNLFSLTPKNLQNQRKSFNFTTGIAIDSLFRSILSCMEDLRN